MAKISRFLLGGVVGAGLALLFAPKPGRDLRRMLLSGTRKALPAAEEEYRAPSDFGPAEPTVAPAPVDLRSQIEQTRRQVETQLDQALAVGPEVAEEAAREAEEETPPLVEEEAGPEGPGVAIPAEEAAAEEAPAAVKEEAPAEETPVVSDEEPPVETSVEEAPAEEATAEEARVEEAPLGEAPEVVEEARPEFPAEEAEQAEAEQMIPGEEKETVADLASEEGLQVEGGWEALKTPAEGEPVLEAELTISGDEEESAPPAPSGIDRDEMRRRIDETRARLKAKAFDAMVSGETFIDQTEAEKAQPHEEPALGMDRETEDRIDQKLKEQD